MTRLLSKYLINEMISLPESKAFEDRAKAQKGHVPSSNITNGLSLGLDTVVGELH